MFHIVIRVEDKNDKQSHEDDDIDDDEEENIVIQNLSFNELNFKQEINDLTTLLIFAQEQTKKVDLILSKLDISHTTSHPQAITGPEKKDK